MMNKIFGFMGAAAIATLSAGVASGSTVGGGNFCGTGQAAFDACTFDDSPAIIKFDWSGSGFVVDAISSLFPSIDGSEFSFFNIALDDGDPLSADFSYTPTGADPLLTGIVVKGSAANDGGSSLGLTFDGTAYFGSFSNSGLPDAGGSGKPGAISNITFFDTEATVIPLPAAGWLLLGGIGGLAALRRKKKAA